MVQSLTTVSACLLPDCFSCDSPHPIIHRVSLTLLSQLTPASSAPAPFVLTFLFPTELGAIASA